MVPVTVTNTPNSNFAPEIVHDPATVSNSIALAEEIVHNAANVTNSALANFAPEFVHNTVTVTNSAPANFAPEVVHNAATVTNTISATTIGPPQWESVGTTDVAPTLPAATAAINMPSGVVSGDLLIMLGGSIQTAGTTLTCPGWTLIGQASNNPELWALRRVSNGSEGATQTVTVSTNFAGTAPAAFDVHRISGQDTTTPVNVSAFGTGSSTTPTMPSVTTTAANCLVIGFITHNHVLSETHTPPANWTERSDHNAGTTQEGGSSDTRIFAATGATGTANQTCNESLATNYSAVSVAIAPGVRTIA